MIKTKSKARVTCLLHSRVLAFTSVFTITMEICRKTINNCCYVLIVVLIIGREGITLDSKQKNKGNRKENKKFTVYRFVSNS